MLGIRPFWQVKAVYAALSYSLALSRCNCCYYSTIPLLILSQANPNHRPIPELAASTDCKARIGCVPSGCFATASFPRYRCQYAYLQRCSLRRVMAKIPNQQVEKNYSHSSTTIRRKLISHPRLSGPPSASTNPEVASHLGL